MSNLDDYYKKYGHSKPKTNADRIRSMTDEELADKFEEIQLKTVKAYGNDDLLLKGELKKYWLAWLKQDYITFVAQEYEKDLNDRLNREGISP